MSQKLWLMIIKPTQVLVKQPSQNKIKNDYHATSFHKAYRQSVSQPVCWGATADLYLCLIVPLWRATTPSATTKSFNYTITQVFTVLVSLHLETETGYALYQIQVHNCWHDLIHACSQAVSVLGIPHLQVIWVICPPKPYSDCFCCHGSRLSFQGKHTLLFTIWKQ